MGVETVSSPGASRLHEGKRRGRKFLLVRRPEWEVVRL